MRAFLISVAIVLFGFALAVFCLFMIGNRVDELLRNWVLPVCYTVAFTLVTFVLRTSIIEMSKVFVEFEKTGVQKLREQEETTRYNNQERLRSKIDSEKGEYTLPIGALEKIMEFSRRVVETKDSEGRTTVTKDSTDDAKVKNLCDYYLSKNVKTKE